MEKQIDTELSDLVSNRRGKFTLGVTYVAPVIIPALWNDYHEQYPNISILLVDALTKELAGMLQEGKIDLYIGGDAKIPNTRSIVLERHRLYCVISKKLLQRERPADWESFVETYSAGIDLQTVAQFPLIMTSKTERLRMVLEQYFALHRIYPQIIFETTMFEMAYYLCIHGSGVGILPQIYLEHHMLRKNTWDTEFYMLPITDNVYDSTLNLVYKIREPQPYYVQAFIEMVKNMFLIE
jgi:DNA-binding transcriptional LysR family regulator